MSRHLVTHHEEKVTYPPVFPPYFRRSDLVTHFWAFWLCLANNLGVVCATLEPDGHDLAPENNFHSRVWYANGPGPPPCSRLGNQVCHSISVFLRCEGLAGKFLGNVGICAFVFLGPSVVPP